MLYYLLIIVALLLPVALFSLRYEAKRTAAFQAIAESMGATFRAQPSAEDKELLTRSYLGSLGENRSVTNIMETARTGDLTVTLLDYFYETNAGYSTSRQTVLRAQSPMLNLPEFQLYPKSVVAGIAQAFGYSDNIDFPEFPEFSEIYRVRGADEAAVRRVFTPAFIQFCDQHRGVSLEGAIDRLFFFRSNRCLKPKEIADFLDEGKRLLALFFETPRSA